MTIANEDTAKEFTNFIGTENYYPLMDSKYAYTDAVHYFEKFLDYQDFVHLMQCITEYNNYKNPFIIAKVIVKDKDIEIEISNGDGGVLHVYHKNYPFTGSIGFYKFYCYNFVIMGTAEY